MTKPELDWSLATDLRLGRPDLDVLVRRKTRYVAETFRRQEAARRVFLTPAN
jgi:hypothetical protein